MTEELRRIAKEYREKKGLSRDLALTFPDVYIINRTSRVRKRSDIKDLSTTLVRDIRLNIPIISANMADITEARMAIALARLGGCGIIHQFAPIAKRVEEVTRVKRADNEIIENPWLVDENDSIETALELMRTKQTSGLLVVDDKGKLVGILTSRDVRFLEYLEPSEKKFVWELMSRDLITITPGLGTEEAMRRLHIRKIEKLPIVDESGKPIGLITARDILKKLEYPNAARDNRGRLRVGAAVGLSQNVVSEVQALLDAGTDLIVVDSPDGNNLRTAEVVREIRKHFPNVPLIAGNIDNPEGAQNLKEAGADAGKVGVGPGSNCETRDRTGFGCPQLTAIVDCVSTGLPIIADGGINSGANAAKALVAGACALMVGGILAATEETPGEIIVDKGKRYKRYRGSASAEFQAQRRDEGSLEYIRASEGDSRMVPYDGKTVAEAIGEFMSNLRSSMAFGDAFSIEELRNCVFERQDPAGYAEGHFQK